MNVPKHVLDYRNHNFGDRLKFADEPEPTRYMADGRMPPAGSVLWKTAPYELRTVVASSVRKIKAPCVILFSRLENADAFCTAPNIRLDAGRHP